MINYKSMDVPERIRYLREIILKIKQNEMSVQLGLQQGSLSDIERKKTKTVTDRVINDICREYNVNENWLRFGEGEMFIETDESILGQLREEYDLSEFAYKLIEVFVKLPESNQKAIEEYILNVAEEFSATMNDNLSYDIYKEVEAYRTELELVAEQKGEIYAALDTTKGKEA